jgi:hypothetical protein
MSRGKFVGSNPIPDWDKFVGSLSDSVALDLAAIAAVLPPQQRGEERAVAAAEAGLRAPYERGPAPAGPLGLAWLGPAQEVTLEPPVVRALAFGVSLEVEASGVFLPHWQALYQNRFKDNRGLLKPRSMN